MSSKDELVAGVIDTVDSASRHRMQLTELLDLLQEAQTQINTSANTSRNRLRTHFDHLKSCVCAALDTRLQELEDQVDETETSALAPLAQCKELLQTELNTAADVMEQEGWRHCAGRELLMDEGDNRLAMLDFRSQVDRLGLDSLPDVPSLAEVPCISVELPREQEGHAAETQLLEAIHDYGRILSHAPVQICEVSERPGAIYVAWSQLDDDQDLCTFRLQRCKGTVKRGEESSSTFHDVYQGPNSSCIVRRLKPLTAYTFRVCGRGEGVENWSIWSVPSVGMTTIPPYEWAEQSSGYTLNPLLNSAERTGSPDNQAAVLFSDGACYTCGHSVVFRIMECGERCADDGIALCADNSADDLMEKSSIFVNCEGVVCIDGQEKQTRLPVLEKGSSLTFDTEVLQSGKVRVTVEVNEKIVTFDWSVCSKSQPIKSILSPDLGIVSSMDMQPEIKLYFALKFKAPDWHISVE